ncbi:hypothetical protein P3L10_015231 [Capsicum annuum]
MLKQCFLSFGMFSEDRVVDVDHMLWLWMAEGLVPRGEERMEDVAECFLNELIRQSLIQAFLSKAPQIVFNRENRESSVIPISKLHHNDVSLYLKLMEDPMPILGMLPNLRNLYLRTDYKGKEITCSDNSFFQLEFLHLESLPKSERWHLATSAMPLIKGLGTMIIQS